jgi:transposase
MSTSSVTPGTEVTGNDAAAAEAICEAVQRPRMRFVPVKTAVCTHELTCGSFRQREADLVPYLNSMMQTFVRYQRLISER